MKKLIKTLVVGICLLAASVLPAFSNAFADEVKVSMVVSPSTNKLVLLPGETYEGYITVTGANQNTENVDYVVSVTPYGLNAGENGKTDYTSPNFENRTNYNSIVDWITIKNNTGTVSPNTTNKVYYTIEVPEDVAAGGQYATLMVSQDSSKSKDGEGVRIQNVFQIASIIYAESSGETRDTGEIIENNVPAFLFDGSKFEATSYLKNTGNIHTEAEYTLQVWPLFSGEEICTNEEESTKSLVFPDTEKYHSESCSLPPFGIFNVKHTVKIFDQVLTVERMVIVCPIWLLFIIIFVILLAIFYVVAKAKKRKEN